MGERPPLRRPVRHEVGVKIARILERRVGFPVVRVDVGEPGGEQALQLAQADVEAGVEGALRGGNGREQGDGLRQPGGRLEGIGVRLEPAGERLSGHRGHEQVGAPPVALEGDDLRHGEAPREPRHHVPFARDVVGRAVEACVGNLEEKGGRAACAAEHAGRRHPLAVLREGVSGEGAAKRGREGGSRRVRHHR